MGNTNENMTTVTNEKQRNSARIAGYTVHGPEDGGDGWAWCLDGDYSTEYLNESDAWDSAVRHMESNRFWGVVVPFFGLDQSFNYDGTPDLMRKYLADYDEAQRLLPKVDSAAETLIGILDASGSLESEAVKRAAYQLRLAVVQALGDHERSKVAQESLDELTA